MPVLGHRLRLVALLLGIVFLAAQFHFCADLTPGTANSHFCPFCATAGSAVTPSSPVIAIVPVTNRLILYTSVLVISAVVPRAISPRAPPAL